MFSSCIFKLNTIYHHTGIAACTADGKSAWTQVSQLQRSLHITTWQFLTTQLCRCENLWLKYPTDTCSSSTISPVLHPNPVSMVQIQHWQLVKTILNTCCPSSTANVPCLYFIFGRTYCKLSFVGFCWYRPAFVYLPAFSGKTCRNCFTHIHLFQTDAGPFLDTRVIERIHITSLHSQGGTAD